MACLAWRLSSGSIGMGNGGQIWALDLPQNAVAQYKAKAPSVREDGIPPSIASSLSFLENEVLTGTFASSKSDFQYWQPIVLKWMPHLQPFRSLSGAACWSSIVTMWPVRKKPRFYSALCQPNHSEVEPSIPLYMQAISISILFILKQYLKYNFTLIFNNLYKYVTWFTGERRTRMSGAPRVIF